MLPIRLATFFYAPIFHACWPFTPELVETATRPRIVVSCPVPYHPRLTTHDSPPAPHHQRLITRALPPTNRHIRTTTCESPIMLLPNRPRGSVYAMIFVQISPRCLLIAHLHHHARVAIRNFVSFVHFVVIPPNPTRSKSNFVVRAGDRWIIQAAFLREREESEKELRASGSGWTCPWLSSHKRACFMNE